MNRNAPARAVLFVRAGALHLWFVWRSDTVDETRTGSGVPPRGARARGRVV